MNNVPEQSGRYMQYVAALSAGLSTASSSVYFVWPSPSIPLLMSDNSPLGRTITNDEASWLVSSVFLTLAIGAFIGGWLIENIGRRIPLLIATALLFVPWVVIVFATDIYTLILSRSVGGIGAGIVAIACPIYNAEIADRNIRGKLGLVFMILRLTANLVVLAVGPYVSYITLAIICALFPITCFSTFIFMKESPYYLTKIGDMDGTRKSLNFFTANSLDEKQVDKMLMELKDNVENDMSTKTTFWNFLAKKQYRKPVIVMACIKTFQQLTGYVVIEAYLQPIIAKTDSIISPEQSSVIFGVVQLLCVFASSFIVDKLGRKPLLVLSALGCSIALCGEGAYFYIQDVTADSTEGIKWLPTTGIALFMIMSAIGFMSVPFILLGELFPANIKGMAVSINTVYASTLGFAVSKSFDPISTALGIHSVFWIFAANCIVGGIFVIILLPETKGETFVDIQDKLNNRGQKGIYHFVV